jgi:inosine-uridine nucleoside N-ribohydrolase
MAPTPRKIIIDTDPGIDDAMAIFMALQSPELDVIGLTTVFGNVETSLATRNALGLLEVAGRTDIPVAGGAVHPLAGPFGGAVSFVHGDDGQGNAGLPEPTMAPRGQSAAAFLVEQIMAQPGQITLVPIGPLTNLALALHLEPAIAHNVAGVVVMGGNALAPGNVTPASEANIHNDPEAADVVFGAAWPVTMVGLDVTERILMTAADLDGQRRDATTAMGHHIAAIVPFYQGFYHRALGTEAIATHDPSTIAFLLRPDLFETRPWPIRVETQGLGRGKTWPSVRYSDRAVAWHGRPPVNVCIDADRAAVARLVLDRLR